MIYRRVCKCEPLLRFNPLNLAKIVCFAKWVKWAKCVSSHFLNEKVLMILTCFILKIKAQLNQHQLVNWKLWVALFYSEQSVEFWQNLHISQASEVLMWRRKKIRKKKLTEANSSNLLSYLLYTYFNKYIILYYIYYTYYTYYTYYIILYIKLILIINNVSFGSSQTKHCWFSLLPLIYSSHFFLFL